MGTVGSEENMVIIKKDNTIENPLYRGFIKTSHGGQFGSTGHFFEQDGVFMSKEEAINIWKALTKKPIECDSEEELFSIQAAVQMLKKSLAVISYDTVKEDHGKEDSGIPEA